MFIAFNINLSSILPLMALIGLYCADVPLSNYSLTHSLFILQDLSFSVHKLGRVYMSGTPQIKYFPSGTRRLKIDISHR